MGKVFPWGDIERKRIPQLEDFSTVADIVRTRLASTDGVIGALLCGSVLGGCYSERSDIDCLVLYAPSLQNEVVGAATQLHMVAASQHIPLEVIAVNASIAKTPLHSIGLSFAHHLERAAQNGGVIKANPLPYFDFSFLSGFEDVCAYLKHKIRSFEKGVHRLSVMSEYEYYRFLEKVLSTPIHIARKVMWLRYGTLSDDTKAGVVARYREFATDDERELFERLIALDAEYSAELRSQLRCENHCNYVRMIEKVASAASDTLRFVMLSALHFT